MELREDSPLNEWKDNSRGMGENNFEFENESENIKIRIETYEEYWNISLHDTTNKIEKHVFEKDIEDKEITKAIADEFANNYGYYLEEYQNPTGQ